MQYESSTEKVFVPGSPYIPVGKPLPLANDPQVKQTRQKLLILIGVVLSLSIANDICAIIGIATQTGINQQRHGILFSQFFVRILFLSFGFYVTQKYRPTGLRVFAWLGVLSLIIDGIVIVVLLILVIVLLHTVNNANVNYNLVVFALVALIVISIVCIVVFAVTVIIVKLAFRLARLIDTNERLITDSIKV